MGRHRPHDAVHPAPAGCPDDGLNPDDYPIETLIDVRDSIDPDDPQSAARAELYFSAFFVAYAADLKIGRVIPQKVDPRLFRSRKTIDVLRVLDRAQQAARARQFLASFEPKNPQYQTLKKMMRIYLAAEESAAGARSMPGDAETRRKDPRVPQIRVVACRLPATMNGEITGSPPVYDEQLVIAVQRFQERHGLEAKGMIGNQTIQT